MAPKALIKNSKDPWVDLYTHLRKKGPEVRNATMQGIRWDFFRGKDFLSYMKANTGLLDALPLKRGVSTKVDDLIEMAAKHMLSTGVIFRVERAQKIAKSGKKLLKFPRRIEVHPQNHFLEDGFYVWHFQLPSSAWNLVGSAGLVVVTIGCCLFPLAPHWCKLAVLYTCLALLGLIFAICIVRAIIFAVVWILFGKHLWVLPNLFSDEVGITDAFRPLYEFEEDAAARYGEEIPKPPSLLSRLVAAGATAATLYCLYTYSPETDKMAAMARTSHKSILEMLDLYQAPKQIMGDVDNSTNTTFPGNATDAAEPIDPTQTSTLGEADGDTVPETEPEVDMEAMLDEDASEEASSYPTSKEEL